MIHDNIDVQGYEHLLDEVGVVSAYCQWCCCFNTGMTSQKRIGLRWSASVVLYLCFELYVVWVGQPHGT
jgi:hypothetical protein